MTIVGAMGGKIGFCGVTPVTEPSGANQAAVTLGNTEGEIGGLAISDRPTQAEGQALREKCEELADDVRALSARMVGFFLFNQRTASRILRGSSVHHEQFANWRPFRFGCCDKRTSERQFSSAFVAAEGLAPTPRKLPSKSDQRLPVVD